MTPIGRWGTLFYLFIMFATGSGHLSCRSCFGLFVILTFRGTLAPC